jgi:putative NADH-flavin reductase
VKALAAGHRVRAVARDPEKLADEGIETVAGDIADLDAVRRAVEGADAVIWAVGATSNTADQPPAFESGARNVVAAMREHGVRRLVALSGAAITVGDERKPFGGRVMSAIVKVAARHVYESKRREYEVFAQSGLDWTLVRPPRVSEGSATGRAFLGAELHGSKVTQGDVAEVMVGALLDETSHRAAPFVSSEHRQP